MAPRDPRFKFGAVFVFEHQRARLRIAFQRRHLQHFAGRRRDWQKRAIGGTPFGAKRRQDNVHHIVVVTQHEQ